MINVDVWADVRCPWCWIGLRRLRRAASDLDEHVVIRHRSYLLEPEGPSNPGQTTAQAATTEWGLSQAQWESKSQHIRHEGQREGLDINIDDAAIFDSSAVHRLLKLAAASDQVDTDAAWESVFVAHFLRNENLGDAEVLRALASGWGLDDAHIEQSLLGDSYADEVALDVGEAQRLLVESVPTVLGPDGSRISASADATELTRFLAPMGTR